MYRSTMFLLAIVTGVMTVGCAKNSGSIVTNDPFASDGDPFQTVTNQSNEPNSSDTARTPAQTQPPGWSRTQPVDSHSANAHTRQTAGMANTGSALRFQTSAPMPEITAEKPAPHKPMPVAPIQTVESTPDSGIQHAQYFNGQSESERVAPTSFENAMPVISPKKSTQESGNQSPVTLEMPVFADEAETPPTTDPQTTAAPQMGVSSDDEWWNN